MRTGVPSLFLNWLTTGLLLLLFQMVAPCQNKIQVDSLEQVIQSNTPDTLKISAALNLSRILRMSDPERARGLLFFADSLAQVNRRPLEAVRVLSGLGILETMLGNYTEAIQYMERALQLARTEKLINGEAESLVNLGIVNRRIGNYPASQEYYLQAITIYDALNDQVGMATTYENLGIVTDLMKDYTAAMAYYERALAIQKSLGRTSSLASLYNNMAIVEANQNNNELAIEMLKEALAANKEHDNTSGVVANYLNLGNFLNKIGKHETALVCLDSVRILLGEGADMFSRANLAYNYAQTHRHLNNPRLALNYANESLLLSKEIQATKLLADAHLILSRIHEEGQDYSQSLFHHKAYASYQDSLFNETKNKEIANYQVQLDVFSKNKRIADQEIEMLRVNQLLLKERRLLILFGVIALLALLVVYLFVQKFIQSKRTRQKLEVQNTLIQQQKDKIESVNQQLEMRLLRAQLNPHFIFNALSSIQHLIAGNDKSSALNYLGKFSRLLRQVLDNASETTVVLAEEIKLLMAYIELEALRFNQDFEYEVQVSDDIDPESTELPVLLLQPLIENAILHGLLPSKNAKKLTISFSLTEGNLRCVVEDNGVGRNQVKPSDTAAQIKHKSHGIHITRQRLANRHESGSQTIRYEDLKNEQRQPAGTRVTVYIPSSY